MFSNSTEYLNGFIAYVVLLYIRYLRIIRTVIVIHIDIAM